MMRNTKPEISLFFLDFDGVIIDSLDLNLKITNRCCIAFGASKELTVDDIQNIDSIVFEDAAALTNLPKENYNKCLKEINLQINNCYENLNPFPGIKTTLKKLHSINKDISIITNNTEYGVKKFLKQHNLFDIFSFIHGAETDGDKTSKIRKISEKSCLPESSMAMFGDSAGDIAAAKSAGITAVGVSWGYQPVEKLIHAGADFIVNSPEEIAEFA